MEEMIRTRILTGERKKRYDENFDKAFGKPKVTGEKKTYFNNDGILIKVNHGQGPEKFKIYTDIRADKSQTDGMF